MRRLLLLVVAGCSTGQVAAPHKVREPASDNDESERETRETHADRVAKRKKALEALVPEGSSCFPTAAKDESKLRLELAALGDNARICAIDADRDRLLGIVERRCVTMRNGATWQAAAFHRLYDRLERADALREMTVRYREHMHSNVPVHDWPD